MDRFIGLTKNLIKNKIFNAFIFTLILLSAVIIGLETYPGLAKQYHYALSLIDGVIIAIFTIEIALKILSNGKRPWVYFSDCDADRHIILCICNSRGACFWGD